MARTSAASSTGSMTSPPRPISSALPPTVARFNANGTQGPAGASSLTFVTRGTWLGSTSYIETVTANGNVSMVAKS